jgi:hypothetical protein
MPAERTAGDEKKRDDERSIHWPSQGCTVARNKRRGATLRTSITDDAWRLDAQCAA